MNAWASRSGLPLAYVHMGTTSNWPDYEDDSDDWEQAPGVVGLVLASASGSAGPVKVDATALDASKLDAIPAAFWEELAAAHPVELGDPGVVARDVLLTWSSASKVLVVLAPMRNRRADRLAPATIRRLAPRRRDRRRHERGLERTRRLRDDTSARVDDPRRPGVGGDDERPLTRSAMTLGSSDAVACTSPANRPSQQMSGSTSTTSVRSGK